MRAKFGIVGLDKMLNGGLIEKKVYLIAGGNGSGKTLLALRFLLEGLNKGERCLYISVDKPPSMVLQSAMLGFGWNLSRLSVMDAVPSEALYSTSPSIRDITAKGEITMGHQGGGKQVEKGELSVEGLGIKLMEHLKTTSYQRIVMDSLSIFKKFAVAEDKELPGVHKLFNLFQHIGATTLITTAIENVDLRAEYLLSSGVIEIEKTLKKTGYERFIRVVKMRGSEYDSNRKRMYITEDGIFVLR
ncbi:MAG: DUF2075 domain-containing protein [Euryarchaeota archaeon]|nr:DUF2075 domain-containing protein [Euryarchaeota archaeon]